MYVDNNNNVGRRDAKHDNNLDEVKRVEVMKFAGQPPPGSWSTPLIVLVPTPVLLSCVFFATNVIIPLLSDPA
jgi:hypothetical protein